MKKIELTADDMRRGDRAMLMKVVDEINKSASSNESSVSVKEKVADVQELDTESKNTVKEVAEAFNALLKALKS